MSRKGKVTGAFEPFVIQGVLDEDVLKKYSESFLQVQDFIEDQGLRSIYWNKDRGYVQTVWQPPWIKKQIDEIQEILEEEMDVDLEFTYAFNTEYGPDSFMAPHKDRDACDVSVSIAVHSPEPWPLKWRFQGEDYECSLPEGDGLVYPGCDVLHWREPNVNLNTNQIFFHYTRKGNERALANLNILKIDPYARRLNAWVMEDRWSRGIVADHLVDWHKKTIIHSDEKKEWLEKNYD